jgi:hypothetical protein
MERSYSFTQVLAQWLIEVGFDQLNAALVALLVPMVLAVFIVMLVLALWQPDEREILARPRRF